jgi:hypothetical protein
MANSQNQSRRIIPRSGGFFQDLADRFRLIGRLMMDSRVNPFLKVLPVGTLIYVFSPIDLLSLNPVDDAFIIWIGTTLFVELCPPQVVEEHMQALRGVISGQWKDFTQNPANPGPEEVVEGEYFDTDARNQHRRPTS